MIAERQAWPPGGLRLTPTTDTGHSNHFRQQLTATTGHGGHRYGPEQPPHTANNGHQCGPEQLPQTASNGTYGS